MTFTREIYGEFPVVTKEPEETVNVCSNCHAAFVSHDAEEKCLFNSTYWQPMTLDQYEAFLLQNKGESDGREVIRAMLAGRKFAQGLKK